MKFVKHVKGSLLKFLLKYFVGFIILINLLDILYLLKSDYCE